MNFNKESFDMFQIGSVVQLKSGGPTMVVKQIISGGLLIVCEWFDGAGIGQTGEFQAAELWTPGPGPVTPKP
jgi:uncharacterized protein YodC (DUF2158 family)